MVLAYRDQIKFLDRLKLIAKAMKGLGPDTTFAKALVAALAEGGRALKTLEKEQEPVIASRHSREESERGSVYRRLQGLEGAHGG